jgi:uronate dehydrogenase
VVDMSQPIMLTGASGALGMQLASGLSAEGWQLRLTDIAPFRQPLPRLATFERADLADALAIRRIAEGCGAIVHFGGVPVDRPFEEVAPPNLFGTHHIYEAARENGARVVFASSNHAVGFHERSSMIDENAALLPDCHYGLSKAYGELTARLYWMKHGVESVLLRIGTSVPEPWDARTLATWLSYGDLLRLVSRALTAPEVTCDVVYAASRNAAMTWWGHDARDRLGWSPQDSSDPFAPRLAGQCSGSPVAERYMGGNYCAAGYSRVLPPIQ